MDLDVRESVPFSHSPLSLWVWQSFISSKLLKWVRRQNLGGELVIDLHMFVSVISGSENQVAKAARIARDAGEVDTLQVILNVLLPIVHFATEGASKTVHTAALLQKLLNMQLQLLSVAWKSEQFKSDQNRTEQSEQPNGTSSSLFSSVLPWAILAQNMSLDSEVCEYVSCEHEECSVIWKQTGKHYNYNCQESDGSQCDWQCCPFWHRS